MRGGVAARARAALAVIAMSSDPQPFEETTEYANYFITYGYLYHQKQMLEDHARMVSYRDAILQNRARFEGATVLDVGTGSGVLAIWAAQAGARKVYAVEATEAAIFAKQMVEHNGLSSVIEVLRCKVEDAVLPEQVDIIVSEWMGYLLVRESMLDSVIYARDKWLRKGGALYPSTATIYLAPIRSPLLEDRRGQLEQTMGEWETFAEYMRSEHGISVDCLQGAYADEHVSYLLRTAQWQSLDASAVMGAPAPWWTLDVGTVTVEELKAGMRAPFACAVTEAGRAQAVAAWFDVSFDGSPDAPAAHPVLLSTAPACGYTHWGQQVLLLGQDVDCQPGDVFCGHAAITRQPKNERTLFVDLAYRLERRGEVVAAFPPPARAGKAPADAAEGKRPGAPQETLRYAVD